MALPKSHEDGAPSFVHAPSDHLPVLEDSGITAKVVLGHAYGAAAPVKVPSDTLYVDVQMDAGAQLPLPKDHEDRAIYVVEGSVMVGQEEIEPGQMLVFRQGAHVSVSAGERGGRFMLCGGEVADGPRHIWWNFVASDKDMIEAAKAEWRAAQWGEGRFSLPPGDDAEWIPID